MLLTVTLVVLIGLIAFGVSSLANKRRPDGPSVPRSVLPHQLDRADFLDPNCEWALLLFTSDSCEACEIASSQVSKVSQSNLMVQSIEFPEMEVLHKKWDHRSPRTNYIPITYDRKFCSPVSFNIIGSNK